MITVKINLTNNYLDGNIKAEKVLPIDGQPELYVSHRMTASLLQSLGGHFCVFDSELLLPLSLPMAKD